MKHVFIVETAHQLKQIHIAISRFQIASSSSLIVVERTCHSGDVVARIAEEFPGIDCVEFESWRLRNWWKKRATIKTYINWCRAIARATRNVVLYSCHYDSDTSTLFYSITRPRSYVLLDEGTASFSVIEKRKKTEHIHIRLLIKSCVYKYLLRLPKKIVYFTRFDLNVAAFDALIRYQLPRIDNPLSSLTMSGNAFIGTSLVDINMIDEQRYLSMLRTIRDQEIGKLVYYPHRKESRQRFAKIEALGYIIKEINEPFESYFSNQVGFHPKIASFHTSAVVSNLIAMFNSLPALVIYTFPNSHLLWGAEPQQAIIADLKRHSNVKFIEL